MNIFFFRLKWEIFLLEVSQQVTSLFFNARRYVEYTDHVSLKYTTVRRGKIHTKFAPYTIF